MISNKLKKIIVECVLEVLTESPDALLYTNSSDWDTPEENSRKLKDVKEKSEYKGEVSVGGKKYNLYEQQEFGDGSVSNQVYKFLYFSNLENNILVAAHSFKELKIDGKDAIQTSLIWKIPSEKGFMRKWFSEHIIPKYDILMSDSGLTQHGFDFWNWIFITYVNGKGWKIFSYNKSTKEKIQIKNLSDLKKFYGNGKFNFTFILVKNKKMTEDYGNLFHDKNELNFKKERAKRVGKTKVGGIPCILYIETLPNNRLEYAFLNLDETEILAVHSFKEIPFNGKKACKNEMIWNSPKVKGFIRSWIDEFVFKKYKYFISADKITPKGMEFWKKIFKRYVGTGEYLMSICNNKNIKTINVNSVEDFESFQNGNNAIVLEKT